MPGETLGADPLTPVLTTPYGTPRRPRAVTGSAVAAVWTPSSPAPARFPRRFARALDALTAEGFDVRCAPRAQASDGMFAGTPQQLADELHGLLLDPEIDLVFCAVGGYTTMRVLPYLDFGLIREHIKPIVGYSDITSLLWAVLRQAGAVTFHGPMVVSEWGEADGAWPYSVDRFREVLAPWRGPIGLSAPPEWTDEFLLWDGEEDVRPRRARPGSWRTLVPGRAEGWLLPGCLPTAGRLFDTPWMPDSDGAILCLETLCMGPEELLGLLLQWRWSGRFERIKGLVIGRHCRPAGTPEDFDRVVLEGLGRDDVPVLVDVDFGHTEPRLTLPVGTACLLDASATSLTLTEPAVDEATTPPTARSVHRKGHP
ncbi:S66 peptidase family protein [Streptomyces sp. NPDC005474]|uniref:S66 peptidase family protein n=1 Tax=Streptomyces sp. NPDC005474 TaxID=3154878 RepID=UPI00345297F1